MKSKEIGIVSDTHGLFRPVLIEILQGVDRIIHAGDIGKPEVLDELRRIAPVTAVRGNIDRGDWAMTLPVTKTFDLVPGLSVHVLHDIMRMKLDPRAAGFGAVISGHSHKACISEKDGVLYLNPGSAGPRRFSLPVTLIRARVSKRTLLPRIILLPS